MNKLTTTTPYKHQETVIELSKDREYFALFMEQGTGKTLVAIATFTHLFQQGKIDGVLILAPNGVHDVWIENEIPKHCTLFPDGIHTAVWHGGDTAKKRAKWQWAADNRQEGKLTILAANIEAVRTLPFRKSIAGFVNNSRWLLIVDESTVVKNHKADQTKEVYKLALEADYRRIMTGTPITQGPLDLFAQCKILSQEALPYASWTAFKTEFANEIQQRFGHRSFAKIINYKNEDKLAKIISDFSYRVLKKDCLDLPPKVYQDRIVELTFEQKKVYNDLATMSLSKISDTEIISVTTVLTLLLRLHQVVLGYIQGDNGNLYPLPHNRITTLVKLLEDNPTKAIIFCRFITDINQVIDALQKMLGAESPTAIARYTGEESQEARMFAINSFQNDPNCRYFVATSAASKGLTLTAAEQVVYYSQGYSLEIRLQSEDRAHRSGQTKTVVYTDLICPGTVEGPIIKALQSKKILAASVMDKVELTKLIQLPT